MGGWRVHFADRELRLDVASGGLFDLLACTHEPTHPASDSRHYG